MDSSLNLSGPGWLNSMCVQRSRTGCWNVNSTGHSTFKNKSVRGSDLIWPERGSWHVTSHSLASHDFTVESTWSCWSRLYVITTVKLICQHVMKAINLNPHFSGGWWQMVRRVGGRALVLTADEGFTVFMSISFCVILWTTSWTNTNHHSLWRQPQELAGVWFLLNRWGHLLFYLENTGKN